MDLVEQAGAGVDHHRRAESRERVDGSGLDESDHPVVRRVDLQQERGVVVDGAFVVGDAGAVRGADLDQPALRLGHDLRHAEAAADLHQLTARHDHGAATRERAECEQHRRRVVVHDDPGFGAARPREERARVIVT